MFAILAIFRKTSVVKDKSIRLFKSSGRVFLICFNICVGMLYETVVLWSFKSLMLSSISSFVVGCVKKKFSFGFLSVS